MAITSRLETGGKLFSDALSINVSSVIGENNSSSKFDATFNNEDGRNKTSFTVGNEVIILADDTTNVHTYKFPYTFDFETLDPIFTGIIENVKFSGRGRKEKIKISGRDYTARLQDVTVQPVVYNNTEISVIVKNIIDNNVTGITYNNVNVTPITISHVAFNHTPVFDALKQLAEQAGFIFYVDSNKDLHFEEKSSTSSNKTFDGTNVSRANFRISDKEIVNQVWVYGGRQLVGAQDVFTAVAGSEYTLTYKPHNSEVFLYGGSVPLVGGIFEMVTSLGSPLQYLVNFDQKKIIFVSGTVPGWHIPGVGSDILVDYKRSVPIVKFAEDKASVNTYGPHSKVIIDKNIVEPSMAKDTALNEVEQGRNPKRQGSLKLQGVFNLVAGTTAIVNLPNFDVNSITYDILEVKYQFNKRNNLHNDVITVKVARKLKDVLDTIKQMILDIKKLQAADIDTTDIITRLSTATGSFGLRVSSWKVQTRNINNAFILDHPVNGQLGSPQTGTGGGQVVLGSDAISAWANQQSGGTWT